MDSYKVIERKLRNLEQFKGNSMRSEIETIAGQVRYVVYSYSTPIASWGVDDYELDDTKFSTTTSRHQNLVRRAWGI